MEAAVIILLVTVTVTSSGNIASRYPAGFCTAPGDVICNSDCSAIEICRPYDLPGTYVTERVATCATGSYCWKPTVECSYQMSSCPLPRNFTCTSVGSFPDPDDCRVYHVCLDSSYIRSTCAAGYAYDSVTKSCSVPLEPSPRACAVSPVPECKDIGQSGALCENESFYYLCFRDDDGLFPVIYECNNGFIWVESIFRCINPLLLKGPNVVNGCQFP